MSHEQLLVITERYWPEGSGGELATHLILEILRKEFDIVVLTGTQNPTKLPGVQYLYEPLLAKREKVSLWPNTSRLAGSQRLQKMLRESDVVYIPRFSYPVIPHARKLGKKVIVHLHGYIPVSYTATILAPYEEHRYRISRDDTMLECRRDLKHCLGAAALWWLPTLARKWLTHADKIICVSKRQADIITDLAPELAGKIEVAYNPLPSEFVNANINKEIDDIPTFLYIGGNAYIKGFHIVMSIIKGWRTRARFILTRISNREIINILDKLNDKDRKIEIHPQLNRDDFIKLHKRSWALLFPSVWEETFGYAVIEAALSKTVPIAFRVGGVGEVIEGTVMENFIINVYDINQFVKKMAFISRLSPSEVIALGGRIRDDVLRKFNIEVIRNRLIKIFKQW
jgi:glycosyltransferase involved in cell wall biosynthesis